MAKLSRKEREILYGKHSPAGYTYLQNKKLKRAKKTVEPNKPVVQPNKPGKQIAYYGKGRETADAMLRRLKRNKK